MKSLVVVAHPDDETLWFSSVLLRGRPDVVCVTSGRDKEDRKYRKKAFKHVMKIMGIENYEFLDHPDQRKRLDLIKLEKDLNKFTSERYDRVFSHGPFGETYNHLHHQDVSYIVNMLFGNVFSTAWNIFPDQVNMLTREEFNLKKYLLGTVYAKEYDLLMDAYELSSVEKFVNLSKAAIEIYYWGIGNFGDNHERLGMKYEDFWGFKNSPYEIDRHAAIVSLAKKSHARRIIEYGACEGVLTRKLSSFARVDCVEKASVYQKRLKNAGFRVIAKPDTSSYDLAVIAAFLEYLENPKAFLRDVRSEHLIVDVILDSQLDKGLNQILSKYQQISERTVKPRWERMYHGNIKERMEVYKLGAHCRLYQRK